MQIRKRSGMNVLHPEGDLTIFEAAEFRESLVKLHQKKDPIALDLSGVARMDSSGVQLIIAGAKSGRMAVTGLTDSIQERFKKIGCGQFIVGSGVAVEQSES